MQITNVERCSWNDKHCAGRPVNRHGVLLFLHKVQLPEFALLSMLYLYNRCYYL